MFSGVEYRTQCFCGRRLESKGVTYPKSKCNMSCPRNKKEKCGGTWAINISQLLIGKGKKCKFHNEHVLSYKENTS